MALSCSSSPASEQLAHIYLLLSMAALEDG
ncbi:MAG TPA: DUF3678 domain-containing protein [Candidatus Korarchaeota archaeon]|nr:DUF3678 domain-containing protein [Candidatus Korarchaeota archaeon]